MGCWGQLCRWPQATSLLNQQASEGLSCEGRSVAAALAALAGVSVRASPLEPARRQLHRRLGPKPASKRLFGPGLVDVVLGCR